MNEVLQRIERLEIQMDNMKVILNEIVQQSTENEKQNLEGYKKLAQAVEILSNKLENSLTTDRIK